MSNRGLIYPLIALVPVLFLSQACSAQPEVHFEDEALSTTPQVATSTIQPTAPGTDNIPVSLTVSVTKDIIYARSLTDDGEVDNHWELDVYAPAKSAGWPVLVLLHGYTVSKESYARSSELIARSGAVAYTINAPVSSTAVMLSDNGKGFREISEVLACAMSYARKTAADYGGDANQVILVAHSWGTLYGVWFALGSDTLATNWEKYATSHNGPRSRVDCVVDLSSASVDAFVGIGGGRYADVESLKLQETDPDLLQIVSPSSFFGQNLSMPIRLLHGERDKTARPESSRAFNEALHKAGYDSQIILFDGGHIVPPELTFEVVMGLTSR